MNQTPYRNVIPTFLPRSILKRVLPSKIILRQWCITLTIILGCGVAQAQGTNTQSGPAPVGEPGYPSRPIRIIVPFPPGGSTDLYARIVAQKMQDAWGQPVVVENRVGATGLIGTTGVQRAQPDGYTLLWTSNAGQIISPMLRNPRPFDPVRDFTPISIGVRYPLYLVINPNLPARNVAEFVAYAKTQSGKLNYSSVGVGSAGHLVCELFNIAAGTNIVHVPYQGAPQVVAAVMNGDAHLTCDSVGNSQSLVEAGKLRGLAITSNQRMAAVPAIPTLAEAGVTGVEAYLWLGLLGPPGLPKPIANKLSMEVRRIMNLDDVRERTSKGGFVAIANTPDEFADSMRIEMDLWARAIREKNIKSD